MVGAVILIVGSASALLGVLYAMAENDLKKLLAYSSIENIGIILWDSDPLFLLPLWK